MMPTDESDPTARRAREVFDAACDGLDAGAANRLRLARRSALAAAPSRTRLAPLAAATAIALALVAWWAGQPAPAPVAAPVAVQPPTHVVPRNQVAPQARPTDPAPAPAIVAVEPKAPLADDAADEPEWAAIEDEDVELYAWLADAPVAPDVEGDAL